MLKSSTFTIGCALCVGAAPEPYLEAALASIADAVDVLAVNENSGLARSANLDVIEASAFAREGRLRVERHPFVDFADMRNRAFAMLGRFERTPDWVMFLDADEVHGLQIGAIARGLLPKLSSRAATLDGYTYHFWGTFDWISDVARRMAFYRYAPDLRWANAVHERIVNLRGSSVVIPYAYHHYGNVRTPRELALKHEKYFGLGNRVPKPVAPDDATLEVYLARANEVRRYRGLQPLCARAVIARLRTEEAEAFERIDAVFRAAHAAPSTRLRAASASLREGLRVRLRFLERPGFYRLPVRAR